MATQTTKTPRIDGSKLSEFLDGQRLGDVWAALSAIERHALLAAILQVAVIK